jgi:CHASE2 domain-containing sensor protein
MAQLRRRVFGVVLLVFGVLLVSIYIAALLQWTPPLVHPMLIVILAIAAFIGGIARYRDRDQSEL